MSSSHHHTSREKRHGRIRFSAAAIAAARFPPRILRSASDRLSSRALGLLASHCGSGRSSRSAGPCGGCECGERVKGSRRQGPGLRFQGPSLLFHLPSSLPRRGHSRLLPPLAVGPCGGGAVHSLLPLVRRCSVTTWRRALVLRKPQLLLRQPLLLLQFN
jgi:hypothetical protein